MLSDDARLLFYTAFILWDVLAILAADSYDKAKKNIAGAVIFLLILSVNAIMRVGGAR